MTERSASSIKKSQNDKPGVLRLNHTDDSIQEDEYSDIPDDIDEKDLEPVPQ